LPTGAVAFTRVAAPFVHRVKNSGNVEYRVVLVELLDDAAGAEPPTTEDRSKSN